MFGQGFNSGFFGGPPCFTDTTDIFKDNSGVALYTLDYDASDSGNATGKFNEGAVFNGSSSKIVLPNSSLGITDASNFSFSCWFNTNSSTQDNQGIIWLNGSNAGARFGVGINSTSQGGDTSVYFGVGTSSFAYINSGTSAFAANTWVHVVAVKSSTTGMSLYVDNVLKATNTGATGAASSTATGDNRIGGYKTTAESSWFNGSIDQVRIFNKAVSSSEVATLYNETKNTTNTLQILGDTSCIATYPFDGSSTDLSGNYNGTDTNILYKYDGTPTNVDFGVGGKSLYGARFNGSSSYITSNSLPSIGTGDFTFSCWFNQNSGNLQGALFSTTTQWFAANGYDGRVLMVTDDAVTKKGDTAYSQDTWNHAVFARESGVLKIYQNGTEVFSGAYTDSWDMTQFGIGVARAFGSRVYYFNGSIDQVRIFSKALSSAEVGKLYGGGAGEIACAYTPTTDNSAYPIANTAYYKLDNNSKDSGKSRGKFNQGVTFIGNSAGIVNTTLQLSSTAHSVSLWMKPQDLTASKWQIMFFSAFNGYPSFTLGKRPDQTTSFHYRNESSNEVYFTLSNADTWYHVVVTRNNSGSTIYVNGSSVATDSNSMGSYGSSSYQKASIGSNPLYPAEYFDGTLDQIRVYDVALTATDVANLYNNETISTADTLAFPAGKTAIATYKLDGDGVDISGNYSGSEGANIVYAYDGTESNIEYRFGRFGQAAVFNGSSSYIDTGFSLYNKSVICLSTWINVNDLSSTQMFFGSTCSSGCSFGGQVNTNGTIRFRITDGTERNATTSNTISAGQWYHVVCVWDKTIDGGELKIYIDGTEASYSTQQSQTNNTTENVSLRLGRAASTYFNGSIDQVRIYSTALTSSQVNELYNEKPEVDTSNFKAVLYDGNSSHNYISNVGFQPDLVWTKPRTNAGWHWVANSIVGGTLPIASNATNSSITRNDHIQSFDTNGFTLGPDGTSNASGVPTVAWCWKGGGDAVSNTDGTNITSSVSANVSAGFSIVKWTGDGNSSSSVGHGLTVNSENMLVFIKDLDGTNDWMVITNNMWSTPTTSYLKLNLSQAVTASSGTPYLVNNTVFKNQYRNVSGNDHIAYCFHSVAGYSKIGTYSGQNPTKVTVTLGFRPSWIMIKSTSNAYGWYILDNKRSPTGNWDDYLYADTAAAEGTSGGNWIKPTDNGFETNATGGSVTNANGVNYIYMAFK